MSSFPIDRSGPVGNLHNHSYPFPKKAPAKPQPPLPGSITRSNPGKIIASTNKQNSSPALPRAEWQKGSGAAGIRKESPQTVALGIIRSQVQEPVVTNNVVKKTAPQKPQPLTPDKKTEKLKQLAGVLDEIAKSERRFVDIVRLGCRYYPVVAEYTADPAAREALQKFTLELGLASNALTGFSADLDSISSKYKASISGIKLEDQDWIQNKAIAFAQLYRNPKHAEYFNHISKLNVLQKDLAKYQHLYTNAAKAAREQGKIAAEFKMENDHNPITLSTQRILRHPLLLKEAMKNAFVQSVVREIQLSLDKLCKLNYQINEKVGVAQLIECLTLLDSNEVKEAETVILEYKARDKHFQIASKELKQLNSQLEEFRKISLEIASLGTILSSPGIKNNADILKQCVELITCKEEVENNKESQADKSKLESCIEKINILEKMIPMMQIRPCIA